MFKIYKEEIEINGKKITLETGKIARQADGAIIATCGESVVLATVVGAKKVNDGQDYFPLSVNYQEKYYAAGKIPGGFFKREARPSENETLVCRLIDRPIRPLFAAGYKNDTQVTCMVISHDLENNPDVVAMIATSAALAISGLPFQGPIGAARVGMIDGEYILNPNIDEMDESDLDLIVAGTNDAVLMVESEAKELSEEIMLGAVMHAWEGFQPVIDGIIELAEMGAKEPWDLPEKDPKITKLYDDLKAKYEDDVRKAYSNTDKAERYAAKDAVKAEAVENFVDADKGITKEMVGAEFKHLEGDVVRGNILKTKKRIYFFCWWPFHVH